MSQPGQTRIWFQTHSNGENIANFNQYFIFFIVAYHGHEEIGRHAFKHTKKMHFIRAWQVEDLQLTFNITIIVDANDLMPLF